MRAFNGGENGEEDGPNDGAYREENNHLARVAEEVDEKRYERERRNVLQDIEDREKNIGKRAPTDKKRDGDAERERDAVGKCEPVGGVEDRLTEREPRGRGEVTEGREQESDADDARHEYPCVTIAARVSTMKRASLRMHDAMNHARILTRLGGRARTLHEHLPLFVSCIRWYNRFRQDRDIYQTIYLIYACI